MGTRQLSALNLEPFRERLLVERARVLGTLNALEAEAAARPDCSVADGADAASFLSSQRDATLLRERQQSLLAEIEAALVRIADGSFGISETTGEAIVRERLEAVPWARGNTGD